jgi:SlyX protein
MMGDDASLQELEIKLAFLERANSELSDVVYRQQRALDGLEERVRLLEAQLQAGESGLQLIAPSPPLD